MPKAIDSCFAESENFRAIYNLAPILPGHSLIVFKQHISSFLEVPEEYTIEMMQFSRKVIRTLKEAFNTSAFDWTLQEGIEAGQTIEHMHIHIIPRKKGDLPEPGDWYPKLKNTFPETVDSLSRPKHTSEEIKNISAKLNAIFKSLQ